jgi:hypothetical protein
LAVLAEEELLVVVHEVVREDDALKQAWMFSRLPSTPPYLFVRPALIEGLIRLGVDTPPLSLHLLGFQLINRFATLAHAFRSASRDPATTAVVHVHVDLDTKSQSHGIEDTSSMFA